MLKNNLQYVLLGLILLTHIFVLTKLIFFPYPELFIYPYLTNHGLKPYSQILDQHFPGLMFLPINFDNLGMNNEIVARLWLISIILITHVLLFFISKQIFKSEKKALLVNFLYLVWQPFFGGWVLWIDSFLPIFLLSALMSLYKRKFALTGLFLGLGILFKQVLIPLSVLVFFYIIWETRKTQKGISYLFGLLLPVILMLIYLLYWGVIKDFWYWTVVFNLTTYTSSGVKTLVPLGFFTRVILVYGMSTLALFSKDKKNVIVLALFLVGSLIGSFDRADFVHFQPSLPFAILATVFGLYILWNKRIFKLIIFVYVLVGIWWLSIFYKGHLSNKVLFFDDQTKTIALKIRQYTAPGDKIFIFGAPGHLYQMSQTLPAGNIFAFQFPWFLKITEQRVLDGIKADKPKIIVSDRSVEIEGEKITNFARDLDQYIQSNYQKIDQVGNTEILHNKD